MATQTRAKALKIHQICDMVPKMSAEAFAALKDDIEKNGQIEAIWIKNGEIVDGRHRYRACHELGRECVTREFTGDDVETFAISMNVSRRQLSKKQKVYFIKRLLALHPEHSNRWIAATINADHKTVQKIRAADASGGEIPHLHRTGLDGKTYPASSKPPVTTSAASLVTKADLDARRFIKWLDGMYPSEFTDPDTFIQQLQSQISRLQSFRRDQPAAKGE